MAYLLKPTLGGFPRLHMRKFYTFRTLNGGPKIQKCFAVQPLPHVSNRWGQSQSSNLECKLLLDIWQCHFQTQSSQLTSLHTVKRKIQGQPAWIHLSPVWSQFSDSTLQPAHLHHARIWKIQWEKIGIPLNDTKTISGKKNFNWCTDFSKSLTLGGPPRSNAFYFCRYPNAGMPQ